MMDGYYVEKIQNDDGCPVCTHSERKMKERIVRRLEDRFREEDGQKCREKIEDGILIAQKEAERCRQEKTARIEGAAIVLQSGIRGVLSRIQTNRLREHIYAAVLVQCHMRGIWGRQIARDRLWASLSVVKSVEALRALRKRSKVLASCGGFQELLDKETNALWYLEPKTLRSMWARPPEMAAMLNDRDSAQARKKRFEIEHRLLLDFEEDEWISAFRIAENASSPLDDLMKSDDSNIEYLLPAASAYLSQSSKQLTPAQLATVASAQRRRKAQLNISSDDELSKQHSMTTESSPCTPIEADASSFVSAASALSYDDDISFSSCKPKISPKRLEEIMDSWQTNNRDRVRGYGTIKYPSGVLLRGLFDKGKLVQFGELVNEESGDSYIGEFNDKNQRHGLGFYFNVKTGRTHCGRYANGVRHGWGIAFHPNGELYEGEFRAGLVHGIGRLESANGDIIQGEWQKAMPHGLIRYQKAMGDRFFGYVQKGIANGRGVIVLRSGEIYRGEFCDDKRHGRGIARMADGSQFAGTWCRGKLDGYGVFVHEANGDKYCGHFKLDRKHGIGRYTFGQSKDFYDGEFANDRAQGRGIYFHSDSGNVYSGSWFNDKRQGRGVYVFANGSKIDAFWQENRVHGKGVLMYANGNKYKGEFVNGVQHGRGEFFWASSKNVYKGEFLHNVLSGQGEMTYTATGHIYRGSWKNDKKNGSGLFLYANGNIYEGNFVNDVIHGFGKFIYNANTAIEESYEGMWHQGKRHGRGKYIYKAHDDQLIDYYGEWQHNLRHGRGTLRYRDGSSFTGDFLLERITGNGVLQSPDGSQYKGEWLDNKRHGQGTQLAPSGTIFSGRFWRDHRHGSGVLTYLSGDTFSGVWDMGKLRGKGHYFLGSSLPSLTNSSSTSSKSFSNIVLAPLGNDAPDSSSFTTKTSAGHHNSATGPIRLRVFGY